MFDGGSTNQVSEKRSVSLSNKIGLFGYLPGYRENGSMK